MDTKDKYLIVVLAIVVCTVLLAWAIYKRIESQKTKPSLLRAFLKALSTVGVVFAIACPLWLLAWMQNSKSNPIQEPPGSNPLVDTVPSNNKKVRDDTVPVPVCFELTGLKDTFYLGDTLRFTLKPNCDGYLKVLFFNGDGAAKMLYPNPYDGNPKFDANVVVSFPKKGTIGMSTQRDDKDTLYFVYTKQDLPLPDADTTSEYVLKWGKRIAQSQGHVKLIPITIKKTDENGFVFD
jgi:hypothetical protein